MMIALAIGLLSCGLFVINAIFAYQAKHIDPVFWETFWYQVKLVPVTLSANLMIGFGVKWLYDAIKQMTFTLTFAKGIEMVVCAVLGWIYLKEVPNWRTAIGMGLIVIGFFVMKGRG